MSSLRRSLWCLTVAALLAATACDSEPTAAQASGPVTTPAQSGAAPAFTGPGGEPLTVTDVEVPAAGTVAPAAVEVLRTLEYRPGEDPSFTVNAVSADGDALVDSMDPSAFDAGMLSFLATSPVSLWNEDGLHALGSTEGLVPDDAHRQVVGGAFTAGIPVWQETTSMTIGGSDWRMFGFDGASPGLLARSEQVDPSGRLGSAHGLSPVADRVGWHANYERQDGAVRPHLVSVPASGGELTVEADLAALPAAAAAGWLVVRVPDRAAGEGPQMVGLDAVACIDLVEPGGAARTLVTFPDTAPVAGLAAGGGEVFAWVDGEQILVSAVTDPAVRRLVQTPGTTADAGSLAVCDERVVWTAAAGEDATTTYVYDPADASVTALPSTLALGDTVCGGSYVAWTEILDPMHVVTLARLTGVR